MVVKLYHKRFDQESDTLIERQIDDVIRLDGESLRIVAIGNWANCFPGSSGIRDYVVEVVG